MNKQLKGLQQYKMKLILTAQQKNIIVGTLLGGATLSFITKGMRTCNLKFDQSIGNEEYINHLYSIFQDWCGTGPSIIDITGGGTLNRKSISFKTYRHSALLFYYGQFYKIIEGKRRKVVPGLLHKWLNDEVLAYWFMDDGSRSPYGYILNTPNFQYFEQKRLANYLGSKFSFQVSVQKDHGNSYRLSIGAASMDNFTNRVAPYILPCFRYKLHPV